MKTRWLDRQLFTGPYLTLVTSQAEFDKVLKKLKIKEHHVYCEPANDATTHTMHNGKGQLVCVIGLRTEACQGKDGLWIAALLVHEAVHVWQQARSVIIGWTDPKRTGGLEGEMEAYAIQNISAELMQEYKRRFV